VLRRRKTIGVLTGISELARTTAGAAISAAAPTINDRRLISMDWLSVLFIAVLAAFIVYRL